jgi:hypothetical protein
VSGDKHEYNDILDGICGRLQPESAKVPSSVAQRWVELVI